MSKSLSPANAIFLDDSADIIRKKIQRAVTDTGPTSKSNDGAQAISAGVKNLFQLLEHFGSDDQRAAFESAYADGTIKYSELKSVLGESIAEFFAPYRSAKVQLIGKPKYLEEVLEQGRAKAAQIAETTIEMVYRKIGLR